MTVTGVGTTLTDAGSGSVGTANGATLNIEDGGTYIGKTGSLAVGSNAAGDQGTVNVTGKDSLLQASIGVMRGHGYINVLDSGRIASSSAQIGGLAPLLYSGTGTLLVSGAGSRWDNSGAFHLISGSLSVLDGGAVETSTLDLAVITAGTGTPTASILVSGQGSELATTGTTATAFQLGGGGSGPRSATLTIADGGNVTVGGTGTINLAVSAASTAALNIGGAVGDAATAAGTLDAALVQFGAGTGAVNFNHTDSAYQFDTMIAGNGTVNQTGPGTTMLTASNTYTGGTTISDGTLQLGNGGISGSITGDIADAGTLAFDRSDAALTLAGVISGTGAVRQIGSGTTTLTGNNTYTGATTIIAGTLALGGDGAISKSSGVEDNGTFDISAITGSSTSITTLSGNGLVELGGATLNLSAAHDTFAGSVQGSGGLSLSSGTETLTGNNTYTGGTTISDGTLQLGDGGTSGSVVGAIINNGTLAIDRSDAVSLGAITGTGGIDQIGSGTTTLAGNNSYTGATRVVAGTLTAGAAQAFSATSATTVATGATLDLAGFSQDLASLDNSGTVSLSGTAPGTTLTVHGDYVGHDGLLRMGTTLSDDASVTDRLIIDGGHASGHTAIQLSNRGGLGALTSGDGIELIGAINGATTTAQTTTDAFALAGGHIDAGAFEYRLYAGDAKNAGENWYLRSTTDTPPPVDGGGDGDGDGDGDGNGDGGVVAYRPEVALHASVSGQLRQADLGMLGNLHRRVGDDNTVDDASGDGTRAWARVISQDLQTSHLGTVSPSTDGTLNGVQAGTDLMHREVHDGSYRVGVYGGQLHGSSRAYGFASGVEGSRVGSLDVRSSYAGAYGTYMASAGWYADAVLQQGWHNGRANVLTGRRDDAGGKSSQVSLELGKDLTLSAHWLFEPQMQLIVDHLRVDNQQITGATITQRAATTLTSRLGMRFKGNYATTHGQLQPYARFNIWHGSAGTDDMVFAGPAGSTAIRSGRGYSSGEVAAGLTWLINRRFSLYGEASRLYSIDDTIGAQSRSALSASAGVRVNW